MNDALQTNAPTAQPDRISAPEGCEFVQTEMVPISTDLGCSDCKVIMQAFAQAPSLQTVQGKPAQSAVLYKCPKCQKTAKLPMVMPVTQMVPKAAWEEAEAAKAAEATEAAGEESDESEGVSDGVLEEESDVPD